MKNKFILIFSVFFLSFFVTNLYSQQDVNGWYWLNGQPTGNILNWTQVVDASNIYALGARGTFMKSTDGGDSWSINSQVGSPDNSSTGGGATRDLITGWFFDANTGLVGGATQTAPSGAAAGLINRTINGGTNWSYITVNDTAGTINKFYFINSNTGYLTGATRSRFFKTTDGGLTWTDQSYGGQYFTHGTPSNTYTALCAIDTSNIFLGTLGKIYTHLPGQDSAWKTKFLPGATSGTQITDIVFKNASTGYACGNVGGSNYFAYTIDGGNTWTQSNAPYSVGGQRDLTYDATTSTLYMAGSYFSIFKSVNDGVSWDSLYFHDASNVNQPVPGIITGIGASGNDLAVVGYGGKCNLSNDGGATWRNKNYSVGGQSTVYASLFSLPGGQTWAGANFGSTTVPVLYSANGGSNWTAQTTAHVAGIQSIDFVNSNTGFICGGSFTSGIGEFSSTIDGGATWNFVSLPSPGNTRQMYNLDFVNESTGWVGGGIPGIGGTYSLFKTIDGGSTFTAQTLTPAATGPVFSIAMVDENIGYLLAVGGFYSTTDGGTNWTRSTNAYVTSTSWNVVNVLDKDVIFLTGGGTSGLKKVVRSVDGGQNWVDLTSNLLPTVTIFSMKWLNMKHGIVGGTSGYSARTSNGGLTWTATNPGISTIRGISLPIKNTAIETGQSGSDPRYALVRKLETLTSISLNVKMSIEGFWNGIQNVTDTVTVELHNATTPFGLVDVAREVITINGYQTYEFNAASTGSYYIVLKHRNGLQTWSAAPVAMSSGGNYNYDFTSGISQAYGNNMIMKSGRSCIYSGDSNQDEVVDGSDGALIDNDAAAFSTGYLNTDLDGNDLIDGSDGLIWENNAANSVAVIKP